MDIDPELRAQCEAAGLLDPIPVPPDRGSFLRLYDEVIRPNCRLPYAFTREFLALRLSLASLVGALN